MIENIIPKILTDDLEKVKEQVNQVKGLVRRVQVGVVDGVYVDNLTVAPADLSEVDFGEFEVEVHLMVEYPGDLLGDCYAGGARLVVGQIERMGGQGSFVEQAQELGLRVKLAIDLFTPAEEVGVELWNKVDGVLLMSVRAGFQGQKFDKQVVEKIKKLRNGGFGGEIEVDGGLNPENITMCKQAGANKFVVGSYLWKSKNIDEALEELRKVS